MEKKTSTRRDFMAKSTAASAGLLIGANTFASSMESGTVGANDKIRVGFIGIGNRGGITANF